MKRSFFKKLIVLTLSIAMLVMSVLPMTIASAAETATVTAAADKNSYAVGETVVINVDVDSATVKSIGLSWTYDNTVLQFVSGAWAIEGAIADVEEEAPRAAFAYETATETVGTIFALTFTVLKDDADTTVTVTPVLKNGTTVIEAAAAVATVSFACEHENLGDWISNETAHWKVCECGEVLDEGTHVFANACDVDCDTCGYIREVDGHVYDNDCDTTCNTCGETRMVGDHVYDNACDATCNSCGEEREVGDHEYSDWQNVEEGHFKVCTECSTQTAIEPHVYDNDCDFDCNVCGATRNVDGHQFSETYENDETGHWYECTICGEKTEVLPHTFDNACDATCNDCGYIREVADHDFGEFQYNDVTHWKECSVCGTISEEGDHVFGEWIVDKAADKNNSGSKHRECVCGKTETKVIPKLLRFYNAALTLTNNIQFNFNVPAELYDTVGYTDAYAVFEYTNKNGTPASVTVEECRKSGSFYVYDFADFAPDMMGDDVRATLYAKNDGEDYISVTVSYSVLKYCTSQLAKTETINNPEFRTLLVDMLHYGAALQVYNGYKLDALVTKDLTATQKSWATTTYPAVVNEQAQSDAIDNAIVTWRTASLYLKDAVSMTVDFCIPVRDDFEGLKIKATWGNKEWTYDCAEEFNNTEDGALSYVGYESGRGYRYQLKIDKLFVTNMRDKVYIEAYKDGISEPVSRQITYSIQSYIYKYSVSDTSNEELTDLVVAMIKYGDAVYAYAN